MEQYIWLPIGADDGTNQHPHGDVLPYTGTFDGNGVAVTGLTKALFSEVTGTVKDMTVTGEIADSAAAVETLTGGTVTGTTAVEIRAGSLNVTGGTLVATAEEYSVTPNGNGSTKKGAAVGFMFPEQRDAALRLAAKLRADGESVDLALKPQKPKKFFSHADQSGAAKAVFVGPDDVEKGVVRMKDMESREEREICLS